MSSTPLGRDPLSEDQLIALLREEEQAAAHYQWSALSQTRADALACYDRDPYGDEQAGSSQVVTSEFADTVEAIMPGLMRIFTATDDAAEFSPGAPGEERWAREASAYVPHVVMRENDGFRILYWLIKDALMYRLGGVTVDLETHEERRRLPFQGLPQEAVNLIVAEAERRGAEVATELAPDADHPATLSGTITLTLRAKRVVVDNIAPEDILFSPAARDQDKASFLGFRKRATASDLVEMGLAPDEVDELRSDRDLSFEEAQRNDSALLAEAGRSQPGDSERPLWLVVAYLRADLDGDGVSEMLRVVYAHAGGTAGRIIERVEWEGPASIVLASPILMSHTIVGRSIFDQVQDLQEIGSVLTRGLLDNLYIVNRPRPVVSDQVVLDTLLDWVPGTPIRLKANARPADNHVAWHSVPSIAGNVLPALEYFQTVRENRTGVVRNNQGLDADSLNKTASGMDMLMGAAQQRQELIARVLAETAIKRLYTLVYRAIKRAASGPVQYWSGQGFATVDPSQWPDAMALSVNVGTGSRDQALKHLALIGTAQEKLIELQGGKAEGPFVTAENIANLTQRTAETLGYKTPGLFFQPPDTIANRPPAPPQQPQPDAAQAQIALLQQSAAADIQIKRQKAAADIALERAKAAARLEIMREEAALKRDLEQQKAEQQAGQSTELD